MNCERKKLWLFIGKTKDNTYFFLEDAFKYEDGMKGLTYAEFELLTEEQLEDRFDNYDWEEQWIEAVKAKQTTEGLDDWIDTVRTYDGLISVIDTSYCCDIEDELGKINEKEGTEYEYSNCIGEGRFGNSYNNDKLDKDNYEYVDEDNFNKLVELYKEYELKAFGKTFNLELIRNKYVNNNRTYFGLIDKTDGGPFCDISENHPEIKDSEIFGRLPGHEAIIIDNDFIACFDSTREAKLWIKDNIKECVITGDIDGRDCFYIKKE